MSPLLAYLWPSAGFGMLLGFVAATMVWRRRPARLVKWLWLDGAAVAAVLGSLMWSGPLGAGRRFINAVDPVVRYVLVDWEMAHITGRLGRAPLTRQVILEGNADDFQRAELAKIIDSIPGVSGATWGYSGGALPIVVEGALASIAGFLLGVFLAYLLERHRRYNAQWDW